MAAKTGYKAGAISATDAVTQLKAAAAKCDNKWMRAHAKSARFFGARESEVKKALSKCGTIKSSLMGAKPRRTCNASAMREVLKEARMALREDEESYAESMLDLYRDLARRCTPSSTLRKEATAIERKLRKYDLPGRGDEGFDLHGQLDGTRSKRRAPRRRGLRGTSEEHMKAAETQISLADTWLERAGEQTGKARTESAIQATTASAEAMANCFWTTKSAQEYCWNRAANNHEKAANILRKKR